jgi:hypothetical protein
MTLNQAIEVGAPALFAVTVIGFLLREAPLVISLIKYHDITPSSVSALQVSALYADR